MSKALGLRVSIMVDLAFLLLCSVVPGELEQSLPLSNRVLSILLDGWVRRGICEEVEVESRILVLKSADEGHSHDFLVELQAGLSRLHSEHSVVQSVAGRIRSRTDVLIVPTDNLDPVSVRVLHKGNVLHAAIGKLLLEGIAGILEPLACSLNVVHRNSKVSKSPVRFSVSVDDAVVRVVLGTVVVGEFQNAVAISPVTITLEGSRSIVGKEIQGELVLREVQLANLVQPEELVELN